MEGFHAGMEEVVRRAMCVAEEEGAGMSASVCVTRCITETCSDSTVSL